ncbi:MAG: transglutaminase domain-containing protein [Verrucomicrobiota bacterium]
MNAAFYIYTTLLVIEGVLAWITGGQGFLAVALTMSLGTYYIFSRAPRQVAEAARLIAAGVLVVAAPFYYQNKLVPLLICFMAMPHFLAATQAIWEKQWGRAGTASENPKMRSLVFSIAFYTSMGLVFLLARGMEPEISRPTTSILAVLVLIMGIAAWELSRVTRLKPAQSGPAPHRSRNLLITACLLALAALIYTGPLPVAAGFLSRISPHWRMDPIEFKNKPPKPPVTPGTHPPEEATAPAPEESAQTGRHQLPKRANLQGTTDIHGFIRLADPSQAESLMEHGPVYVRSHTLNRFDDGKWEADVTGGVWVRDSDDGKEDGMVTLRSPERPVAYEMFLMHADGYTLPAIQGLTAIALPRVYAVPGDILQTTASGNFRYRAVSGPLVFDNLPNSMPIRPGKPESPIHTVVPKGELGARLHQLSASVIDKTKTLPEQITALRRFFSEHYQYSGVMTNRDGIDPLQNFLFNERKGYCDFFATGAALLLRDAGIPSRMAYGFATDEYDTASATLTFRNRNAHSWTEVYIDKIGWTVCDFTPRADIGKVPGTPPEPPPPPELDPSKFADAAKQEPPPPPDAPKTQVESNFLVKLFQQIAKQPWVTSVKNYGPAVVLAVAAIIVAFRFLRRSPEEAAAAAAAKERAAREKQPAYFMEFLRVTAGAGHPKPDGATPMEHYTALARAGLPVPPLRPLIHYHYAQRYEDIPPDDEREKSFFDDLKTFEKATTVQTQN